MRKSKFGMPSSDRSRPKASHATPNSKGANPSWTITATVFISVLLAKVAVFVRSVSILPLWQLQRKRSVSAMFMVILLAALSTVAIASTIAAVRNDGYRRTPTDWSRLS